MPSTKYYLTDVPLMNSESFSWRITSGTSPYITKALFPRQISKDILDLQRNKIKSKSPFLTLFQNEPGRKPILFENIIALYEEEYSDPRFSYVVISDNRFFWNYHTIKGAFNVRTLAGDKFVVRSITSPIFGEIPTEVSDNYSFKSWSVLPEKKQEGTEKGTPWKLSQIIVKVLETLKKKSSLLVKFNEKSAALKSLDKLKFEGIYLDGGIGSELSKLLSYAPQIGIFVDRVGTIQFYDRHSGDEVDLFRFFDPLQDTGANYIYAKHDIIQPRGYKVLFDKQIEVAFKFQEFQSKIGYIFQERSEKRTLINVAPSPDKELTLLSGEKIHAGQFTTFQRLVEAWKKKTPALDISIPKIRETWVRGNFLAKWAELGKKLTDRPGGDPRADWPARIFTIQQHYRQTYQIAKKWRDKMINILPIRVSVIDQATGTFARSDVYQDFGFHRSKRTRFHLKDGNVLENSKGLYTGNLDTSKPCPVAKVLPADLENGIFSIDFNQDPWDEYEKTYPSKIYGSHTSDPTSKTKNNFFDEKKIAGVKTGLLPEHEMEVILTASPAPNSAVELHGEDVSLKDIRKVSPAIYNRVKDAKGPIKEIRVGANILTALVAYTQKTAAGIEANFGVGNADPDLNKLNLLNKKHLRDVAIAMALADASKRVDRFKGSAEGLTVDLNPRGTISSVGYPIYTNGKAGTVIQSDGVVSSPDFINFLPADTRAFILRQVSTKSP